MLRKYSIENPVTKGRVITVKILITAVYDIDKAVSPLASFVMMLEVTPPGHDANIITPTAISSVNPNSKIVINATVGRINIWFIIPTKKALGAYIRFVKSFIVKPRPRVSIIKTKDSGRTISIIILKKDIQ